MPDRYSDFASLAAAEARGVDFRIVLREASSELAIVAPHGGGIEPGTSEIAGAVAGRDHTLYAFEGLKQTGNEILHVTSTQFDEPLCLAAIGRVNRVVTIHGEGSDEELAFVGGLDFELAERISSSLIAAGFSTSTHERWVGGEPLNLCNRSRLGRGVQLELSRGLRRSLFASLGRSGRGTTTPRFGTLVSAVRAGIE